MHRDLWQELCSYENLELAFKKARKHKTLKEYVIEFEKTLEENLLILRAELLFHSYRPKPLSTFIIHDPKTRKISKSDFRDRVIHHALCNIIEPVFEKTFIYDSYANRTSKGPLKALERFDCFKKKISKNNTRRCFVLKADIKKYFDNVDHNISLAIIKTKINDKRVLWLIKTILANHSTTQKYKGMPLGNLTSQFFANVYLNELDHFVTHKLKAGYYIRYVDDFVILHTDKKVLEIYMKSINDFLKQNLGVQLHPDKSKIIKLKQGISFLGFRVFYYHKLLRKANIRKIRKQISESIAREESSNIIYDLLYESFQGWSAYAEHANTYRLRMSLASVIGQRYIGSISATEISRLIKFAEIKH